MFATNSDDDASEPASGVEQLFHSAPAYGDTIGDAVASGEVNRMRRVAKSAEIWMRDEERRVGAVRDALAELYLAITHLDPDSGGVDSPK